MNGIFLALCLFSNSTALAAPASTKPTCGEQVTLLETKVNPSFLKSALEDFYQKIRAKFPEAAQKAIAASNTKYVTTLTEMRKFKTENAGFDDLKKSLTTVACLDGGNTLAQQARLVVTDAGYVRVELELHSNKGEGDAEKSIVVWLSRSLLSESPAWESVNIKDRTTKSNIPLRSYLSLEARAACKDSPDYADVAKNHAEIVPYVQSTSAVDKTVPSKPAACVVGGGAGNPGTTR